MADGTYGVTIEAGEDLAFALNRSRAIEYAVACHTHATRAEHDTAVAKLLINQLGVPQDDAITFIRLDLQPDRPDDIAVTEPIQFKIAIGRAKHPRPDAGQLVGLIQIACDGTDLGWISPQQLRTHAAAVLDALAAADLDAELVRGLVSRVGLDQSRARAVVSSLAEFMPSDEVAS